MKLNFGCAGGAVCVQVEIAVALNEGVCYSGLCSYTSNQDDLLQYSWHLSGILFGILILCDFS